MLLPKQSPPVERKPQADAKLRPTAVKPQMVCECRAVTGTYWCQMGKSFYNTGVKC